MANKIEIIGLDKLKAVLNQLPKDIGPTVIRAIAKKAASPVVRVSRHLIPQSTGQTAKTIGVLKVKDRLQPFVEVGFKGRSLGPIFLVGTVERRKKSGARTGKIKKIPNPFFRAADITGRTTKREVNVEISKVIARALRRKGYTVR